MAAPDYIAAVLADAPAAFYKMQEASGLPQDSSGNARHMTTDVGAAKTYGVSGPMFDGSILHGGGARFSSAIWSTVVNNMTMEVWFYREVVTVDNDYIIYNGNAGGDGWGIVLRTTGEFRYLAGGVAFGANSVKQAVGWTHLVVKRDAGTWSYYFNGLLETANAGADTPGTPATQFFIASSGGLQERLAYISVYETALSAARIAAHYQAAIAPPNARFGSRVPLPMIQGPSRDTIMGMQGVGG